MACPERVDKGVYSSSEGEKGEVHSAATEVWSSLENSATRLRLLREFRVGRFLWDRIRESTMRNSPAIEQSETQPC